MTKKSLKIFIKSKEINEKIQVNGLVTNNKIIYYDEYKTVLDLNNQTLIRKKENYCLKYYFKLNETTKGTLKLDGNTFELNIFTKKIIILENNVIIEYTVNGDDPIRYEIIM